MILKHQDCVATHVTPFDLLGNDETALSKAFAYVLAKERSSLFAFLRYLGIHTQDTTKNYRATTVETEHSRRGGRGRTDIEILKSRAYHIIVECKVGTGKVAAQRTKYLGCFADVPHRVMCFITQVRDTNKEKCNGIIIRHLSWLDVLDLFEKSRLQANPLVRQFMSYAIRTHKMKAQKEILVQDLSNPIELLRWKKYGVYRRDVTFGTPLYFAPYFTRSVATDIGTGMKYLSPVLGVLTLNPRHVREYLTDIQSFTNDKQKVQKWIQGVELVNRGHQGEEYTFYFLGDPVDLPRPLLKDGAVKKGRGKNWIAGMIPKNRCVTFAEVVRRLKEH